MNETFLSRRKILQSASSGFGYLAFSGLAQASLSQRPPLHQARAKRVIFLCMSGGPAQLDTFDYKPQTGKKPHPGSIYPFHQHGDSGLWISELMPETAKHADKLCLLNGMHADTGIHASRHGRSSCRKMSSGMCRTYITSGSYILRILI